MTDWIKENFEKHLALLKALAVIPAPSHREEARAAFIQDYLKGLGFSEAYIDEAGNVLLPFFCQDRRDITVYMAHTDVVFPDLTPLPLRQEGGRLYAPGIGDDTANVAAILTLARYIKEKGLIPREPVLFALNTCEEGLGNLKGVRQLMKDFEGRIKEVISFDCVLPGGVVTRAVGSERWRVRLATRGGHSYNNFGNPNAIHLLSRLIGRLYEQPLPDWEDQRTTYNVGVISGGTTVNSIAQEAEMLYEYRSDDKKALAMMREQFLHILKEAESPEASLSSELLGERPCGSLVDPEKAAALWNRCARVVKESTGAEIRPRSASTDANIPLSLGIPAATFGLYYGEKEHTREEWLDIESLRTGLTLGLSLVLEHFA